VAFSPVIAVASLLTESLFELCDKMDLANSLTNTFALTLTAHAEFCNGLILPAQCQTSDFV